jgi:arsenate reductase-like glutaredoxin family protein
MTAALPTGPSPVEIRHNPSCGTSRNTLALIRHVGIDAMIAAPVPINRPFVFSPLGVRLCRPDSALVLDILPPCDRPFAQDDGEDVIDGRGNRVR